MKSKKQPQQSLPLFRVTLLVSCPQGAHRGQRRPCSDVQGALAALKLCSFASRLTRDERMQSPDRGQRPASFAPSQLRSSYRRLNSLTHRRVMKGPADSFEIPWRGYLFVGAFKIRTKGTRRRKS